MSERRRIIVRILIDLSFSVARFFIFGGILLGMFMHTILPEHHLIQALPSNIRQLKMPSSLETAAKPREIPLNLKTAK
jgi:hypothetical protein